MISPHFIASLRSSSLPGRPRLIAPVLTAVLGLALPAAAFTPAELIYSGDSSTGITSNSTHLFVALDGLSLETCAFQSQDGGTPETVPVLIRIDKVTLAVDVLRERCTAKISALNADEDWLYYRDSDTKIRRLPVVGGNAQILVNEDTGSGDVATDGDYLYWDQKSGTTSELFRVPVTGGSAELLATFDNDGRFIGSIAVDATHVYWAEGKIGSGVIRRLPKAGGAPTTLAGPGDAIDNSGPLALDANFVYWAESGSGRIRRLPKGGGAILDYISNFEPDTMGQSIGLTPNYVVWTDTTGGHDGRVRRLDKEGGQVADTDVDNLSILALGPANVHLADTHIYWSEFGAVYRQEVDAEGVAVDLTLEDMEITQGIQNRLEAPPYGDVPIIEDKTTWVRVYPDVSYALPGAINVHQDHVPAVLHGSRGGQDLPGSPLQPVQPVITVYQGGEKRHELGDTFNFLLPSSWRQGTVTLEAEINHGEIIQETDYSNNRLSRTVVFDTPDPLCTVLVPVRNLGLPPKIDDDITSDTVDLLRIIWPTSRIHRGSYSAISEAGGEYEIPDDGSKILNKLEWLDFWAIYPDGWCENGQGRTHWVGVLDVETGVGMNGLGRMNDNVSWFMKIAGASNLGPIQQVYYDENFGSPLVRFSAPLGAHIVAQELGHNFGRDHVDCGNPEGIDTSYPYNPCRLGDGGDRDYWGLDHRYIGNVALEHWSLISPAMVAKDFMSYGDPPWVSDYTYKALLALQDGVPADKGLTKGIGGEDDTILVVSAVFAGEHDHGAGGDPPVVELDRFYTLPVSFFDAGVLDRMDVRRQQLQANGRDWSLELLDGDGKPVATYRFAPSVDPSETHGAGSFIFPVRLTGSIQSVVVRHDDEVVGIREASAIPPEIRLLAPAGGAEFDEGFAVEWQSSDADGDRLRHDISYSPDLGRTWYVLAQELGGMQYLTDSLGNLPGSQGRALVRVVVTDGFHSSWADSARPFTVAFRDPTAIINQPKQNDVLALGHDVILRGEGIDPEDGELEGAELRWLVDGALVGTGREVGVSGLAAGKHTAVLTASDSHDQRDTASVEFWVAPASCPVVDPDLEIVFVVENSRDMELYEEELCVRIPAIVALLETFGVSVRSEILAYPDLNACAARSLREVDPDTAANGPGDWLEAVASVAGAYEWVESHTRILVPVVRTPSPDDREQGARIDAAVASATSESVSVVPWLMPFVDGPPAAALSEVAGRVAAKTAGDVVEWTEPDEDISLAIHGVKARLSCPPDARGIIPGDPVAPGQDVVVVGENLHAGLRILVGGRAAQILETAPDGTWTRLLVPFDVGPGEELDLELERPGSGRTLVMDAFTTVDPPGVLFLRGDANDDSLVDISDPVVSLEWQFLGIGNPGCVTALDVNGDGTVDITDPIYSLEHDFLGGPAPVAPYPACGPESLREDVSLGCEVPPRTCN